MLVLDSLWDTATHKQVTIKEELKYKLGVSSAKTSSSLTAAISQREREANSDKNFLSVKLCTVLDPFLKRANKNSQHHCTSYLSAGEHVSGQFDLGKVALANGFEQPVVAYVGLLRLLGAAGRTHARPAWACADLLTAIAVRGVLWKRHNVRQALAVEWLLCVATSTCNQWWLMLTCCGTSAQQEKKHYWYL